MSGNFLDGVRYSVAYALGKRPKILVWSIGEPSIQSHAYHSLPGDLGRDIRVLDHPADYPRKRGSTRGRISTPGRLVRSSGPGGDIGGFHDHLVSFGQALTHGYPVVVGVTQNHLPLVDA